MDFCFSCNIQNMFVYYLSRIRKCLVGVRERQVHGLPPPHPPPNFGIYIFYIHVYHICAQKRVAPLHSRALVQISLSPYTLENS